MSTVLKDQDFQTLCHKFGLPELIQKWINSSEKNSDDDYLIHEDLCNMHPEDALLCIALCLTVIQNKYEGASKHMQPFQLLIENIIKNYAELALERLHLDISQNDRTDIEFVAADLKDLAKSLEELESRLPKSDSVFQIIQALSIQASAQAEIASYVLAGFKEQERKTEEFKGSEIPFLKTLPVNDNIRAR